jgi:phosphoribosylformylglycinamidine synthase
LDCIILPGGFSYGDYLRAGALAHFSPIMESIKDYVQRKRGLVIGICNGFQILTESQLLPGALLQNRDLKFICKAVTLKVENNKTPFTTLYKPGQKVEIPIAHMEGNYTCDADTMKDLKVNKQIVFTYSGVNPNGSMGGIAGICNKEKTVLGMMPHPERVLEKNLGGTDGLFLFNSIKSFLQKK